MQALAFIGNVTDEPYTTPEIVAEATGNDFRVVRNLIYKHKDQLEQFGILHFQNAKLTTGRGRPRRIYHLNEQQATLLITFLDNTPQVVEFKTKLVKEFYQLRADKIEQVTKRIQGKPQRRTLTESIKSWKYCQPWSYKNLTDLLLKQSTGKTAKQLEQERGGKVGLDCLTPKEQSVYDALQNVVLGMVDLGKSYKEIKTAVLQINPLIG